ncbi:hypothetical protein KBA73_00590 [Patescibacteria group bacterium]|nr:hypothetical protein [Patescibacteria group bacterium]
MSRRSLHKQAHVVAVNMGYGHERAAYGLAELCGGEIIVANNYPGIPKADKDVWDRSCKLYESISRLHALPWIGPSLFQLMDVFQRIPAFYPRRDMSRSNFQIAEIYYLLKHHKLGQHLIEKLAEDPLPLICTFFLPAYAAELNDYPGDIYIAICDADMFRTWVPYDAKASRIQYLAPTGRVVERLKLYGVPSERIHLTGFPLPKYNIGKETSILKHDLSHRIANLDPQQTFRKTYQETLTREFGKGVPQWTSEHPLTITFGIGGAGAQKNIAWQVVQSLRTLLLQKQLRLNIEVGTRTDLARFFHHAARNHGLQHALDKELCIHAYADRPTYFTSFQETLRTTDILWTKPSELAFYTGLGLPIVMAPPIGSQEDYNKAWLEGIGGGIAQQDPRYTHEWLMDWVHSGALARYAWNGYIEAPTHGAYRIESLISGKQTDLPALPYIV